jgi:hypothetical protein
VQGYHFENDAFGNIIFDIEAVPAEQILNEFGTEIASSYSRSGSPGPWAADLNSAAIYLNNAGTKGFILSASYGLSGWVLAKTLLIVGERSASR